MVADATLAGILLHFGLFFGLSCHGVGGDPILDRDRLGPPGRSVRVLRIESQSYFYVYKSFYCKKKQSLLLVLSGLAKPVDLVCVNKFIHSPTEKLHPSVVMHSSAPSE